jgi:hypothetical protein
MSILEDIAAALGPVVRDLAGQFGCRFAIYRPVVSTAADGSPVRTYPAPDPAWSDASGFFEPGSESSRVGTDALAKPFGVRTTAFGRLTPVQNASGVLPLLSPFDGVKILSGPYTGYTWLAEAEHVPDPINATGPVRVIAAPVGVIP